MVVRVGGVGVEGGPGGGGDGEVFTERVVGRGEVGQHVINWGDRLY